MKMKIILTVLLTTSVLILLILGVILCLATPRQWPMTPGSITIKKILIDGQSFILVNGEQMNYLGQIQSINVQFDDAGKHLVVTRCLIRWNPFSKIVVNNQWPVFYPLAGVKPGKYSVVYKADEGDTTAGNFDVP